jgi:DNA-binding FadR family transcriptional regulator
MLNLPASQNRRRHASTAVAAVLDEIEGNITAGVWPPGHRLPTERELEERFGVARNTVRKGLKRLEQDGKIVRHVGRGSFVAEQLTSSVEPPAVLDQFMGASPAAVMEVRLMLEPHAAQLAASRANAADLRKLEYCLEQAALARDLHTFEMWDGTLHRTIIEAVGNELLSAIYAIINDLRNQTEWKRLKERTVTGERRSKYHKEHTELVSALKERDGELARRLMHEHLLVVRENLLGL